MTKILNHLRGQYLGALALFVALGGTSYAAISLPAGSVGTKQLRSGAVTNKKLSKGSVGAADLDRKSIGGYVRDYAEIEAEQVTKSHPRATLDGWHPSGLGAGGAISWQDRIPASCFALATTFGSQPSFASAHLSGESRKIVTKDQVQVLLSGEEASVVDIAVICPLP